MHRRVLLLLPLCSLACATAGNRYFAGEGRSCDDVAAARAYEATHPVTDAQKSDVALDTARCELLADGGADVAPLLDQAVKLDPKSAPDVDVERAALLARDGKMDQAVTTFQGAVDAGFNDFEQLMSWPEFDKLLAAPELERTLVSMAAEQDPVEPRVLRLADKLHQIPVTPVVVEANPAYGLNTFVLWRGQVLESHYDAQANETAILLEELVPHAHAGAGSSRVRYVRVWTPAAGYVRVPQGHGSAAASDADVEYEATGRFFGLRVPGFPRELVEAPDLEVVGYYQGPSTFTYRGDQGDAPTLQVIRAVPFESGVHPGRPVARLPNED